MLKTIITAIMMNSTSIRLNTSSSVYLVFVTKSEGTTNPNAPEARTANVEIAVTAGRYWIEKEHPIRINDLPYLAFLWKYVLTSLGKNQFAANLEGELVIKQFPRALITYPIITKKNPSLTRHRIPVPIIMVIAPQVIYL